MQQTCGCLRHCAGLVAGAVLVLGCTPDLGESPFFCNAGSPACPDGYRCDRTVTPPTCVTGAETPDASVADLTGDVQQAVDTAVLDARDSSDADVVDRVVITEFFANPQAVTDGKGEYLELFNAGTRPIDISGWTLKDEKSDTHRITPRGPLIVPAGGFLLIGLNSDQATNGGVGIAYAYDNFFLSNTADEIVLLDAAGNSVFELTYAVAAGFKIVQGRSLSLKQPGADVQQLDSWCLESSPWSGSQGDMGSPGRHAACAD